MFVPWSEAASVFAQEIMMMARTRRLLATKANWSDRRNIVVERRVVWTFCWYFVVFIYRNPVTFYLFLH